MKKYKRSFIAASMAAMLMIAGMTGCTTASAAMRSDSAMWVLRFSMAEVMAGKPHLARIKSTRPKMRTIQNRRPESGVMRFMPYRTIARRQVMTARRLAPSIIPATMRVVLRMLPAASG